MASFTADWHVTTSADNATATATKAAITGQRHVITHITASFDNTAANKLVSIFDGTTLIDKFAVTTTGVSIAFPHGLRLSSGNKAEATLAASGTGGTTGYLTLHGYTE